MIKKSTIRKYLLILVIVSYFLFDLLVGLSGGAQNTGKLNLSLAILMLVGNIFLLRFKFNKIDLFFFIWFIWAFLGTKYWNIESYFLGLPGSIYFTLLGLNLYFFFGRLSNQKEKLLAYKIFVIGGILMTILTLILRQKLGLIGVRFNTDRVNANAIAYYSIFAIFCLVYLWNQPNNNKKPLILIGIFLFLNSVIIFTASRKAFLGEFFFLAATIFYIYKSNILKKPFYLIFGIILISSIYFIFKDAFMNSTLGVRLTEAVEEEKNADNPDERLAGRGHHYVLGYIAFKEHPVLGVGLGNINKYFGTRLKSHSEYISMFGETGSVGFILYFTGFFLLMKNIVSKANKLSPIERKEYFIQFFALITILLIAFGRWNYDNALYWIFIGMSRNHLNSD